ncbi:MAG: hypothetical protein ABI302_08450 [Lacisediminihabitans sp.]
MVVADNDEPYAELISRFNEPMTLPSSDEARATAAQESVEAAGRNNLIATGELLQP